MGDLGGLIDIIWVLGACITAALTRNVLEAALITDSYQIQKYNNDDSEYYKSTGGLDKQVLTNESESPSDDEEEEKNRRTEIDNMAEFDSVSKINSNLLLPKKKSSLTSPSPSHSRAEEKVGTMM